MSEIIEVICKCGTKKKILKSGIGFRNWKLCDNCLIKSQGPYNAKQKLIDRQDAQLEARENGHA